MDAIQRTPEKQSLTAQRRLADSETWDGKQDDMEDIESLLEGLPLTHATATSLSDKFDILPNTKTDFVAITSSQRLIEMNEKLSSAMSLMTTKFDSILNDINCINIHLHALEQKQQENTDKMAEQQINRQQLQYLLQTESENRNDDYPLFTQPERLIRSSEGRAPIDEDSAAKAVYFETAPTCFLLEFYPRPGNGYSGRIHHTLSKQAVSFKGLNLDQILPFIQKHLPQVAENEAVNLPIIPEPVRKQSVIPMEQITSITEPHPVAKLNAESAFIKHISLIQDEQKTTRQPFRLQAGKAFKLELNLALDESPDDTSKTDYMLRYKIELVARHLQDNKIAYKSKQEAGLSRNRPNEIKILHLNALDPGIYFIDIHVAVPQKNISEQMQLEIKAA